MMHFFCKIGFILALLGLCHRVDAAPLFGNTMDAADYGGFQNNISTLQPAAWYPGITASTLRTNDYQNLQVNTTAYNSSRPITRINQFLVSVAGTSSPDTTNGPQVCFPVHYFAAVSSDPNENRSPARNITTNSVDIGLTFASTESTTYTVSEVVGTAANSPSFQSMQIVYDAGGGKNITDYCVTGNVFHDVKYTNLTPQIRPGAARLTSATVDNGVPIVNPVPPNGHAMTGSKFKLQLTYIGVDSNGSETHIPLTWILYFQDNTGADATVTLNGNFNGSGTFILVGTAPFTGYIRSAVVQTTPVQAFPVPTTPVTEVPLWSTTLGIQVIAPTPQSMFMLWPLAFSRAATQRINANLSANIYTPYCPWYSIYLPLQAVGTDPNNPNLQAIGGNQAIPFFQSLYDMFGTCGVNASNPYDNGTNPFIAAFGIAIGSLYQNDVATYQTGQFPTYQNQITAGNLAASAEAVYDSYHKVIPTSTDLTYNPIPNNLQYSWEYVSIIGAGSPKSNPLVIFPSYKTLLNPVSPLNNFILFDPIKGPLYTAEASAPSSSIIFSAPEPATFGSASFPSDLWNRLGTTARSKVFKRSLVTYLAQVLGVTSFYGTNALPANLPCVPPVASPSAILSISRVLTGPINYTNLPSGIPPCSGDGYGNGKTLNQAALTVRYGSYILQQLGQDLGFSNAEIKAVIQTTFAPLVFCIEQVVQDWLITIQASVTNNGANPIPTTDSHSQPLNGQQQGCVFSNEGNLIYFFPVPNFFVFDTAVPGINYSLYNMMGDANTNSGADFGNGAYNDHHFAYGYWLAAAAACIEWENSYGSALLIVNSAAPGAVIPWIARPQTSAIGVGGFKMKSFVDVLWRDTRNPDTEDPSLPYNRYMYPWLGIGTANGLITTPYGLGRNQESMAEDFNSWVALWDYVHQVNAVNTAFPAALSVTDLQNFDFLEGFAKLSMSMNAQAGALYYNSGNWVYSPITIQGTTYSPAPYFNFNVAAAQQYDAQTSVETFFGNGSPSCFSTGCCGNSGTNNVAEVASGDPAESEDPSNASQTIIMSPTRLDNFYDELLQDPL